MRHSDDPVQYHLNRYSRQGRLQEKISKSSSVFCVAVSPSERDDILHALTDVAMFLVVYISTYSPDTFLAIS